VEGGRGKGNEENGAGGTGGGEGKNGQGEKGGDEKTIKIVVKMTGSDV